MVLSDDVLATLDIMEKVGVKVVRNPHQLVIHGQGKISVGDDNFFDCNESGSTLRFLIPVLALSRQKLVFTGKPSLFKRPMQVFEALFKEQGFCFQQSEKSIILSGTLSPGTYPIPGNVSSQFISGLMFALPLLNGDSKIEVTSPLESAEYVDLTLEMLRHFQIRIDKVEDGFIVYGNQTYRSANVEIESDYSQLAFFAVAGLLSGPITCKKFLPGSLQPDRRIIDIVRKMGGLVSEKKGEFTFQKSKTVGAIIDVSQCPDIAPVLSMLGALSEGRDDHRQRPTFALERNESHQNDFGHGDRARRAGRSQRNVVCHPWHFRLQRRCFRQFWRPSHRDDHRHRRDPGESSGRHQKRRSRQQILSEFLQRLPVIGRRRHDHRGVIP
ncbi:MAG: hypothetical protein MZU97_21350 [Bacillus subtilis]|nr:hypothetical protein [Bacillus subtilis]